MPIIVTMDDKSVFTASGTALSAAGPDSLSVKQDGFLISQTGGNGASLTGGPWTVTVDGNITALGSTGIGLFLSAASSLFTSKITIGAEGSVYGGAGAIRAAHATTIANKGSIFANTGSAIEEQGAGAYTITNSGTIDGNTNGILLSGDGAHTITNSGLIFGATNAINATGAAGAEKVLNTGTIDGLVKLGAGDDSFTNSGKGVVIIGNAAVAGLIDMGAGNDKFLGGAGADLLVDGTGNDTYTFGAGNDTFRAASAGVLTEVDKADGGAGIDTYDFSASGSFIILNLDIKAHGKADLPSLYDTAFTASTAETFDNGIDTVRNFENAKGSNFGDVIFGSAAINLLEGNGGDDDLWGLAGNDTLNGGAGVDFLFGGAGKDTMTGGADGDNFVFLSSKDSGLTAATRDIIKDFQGANVAGGDLINVSGIDAKIGGTDDKFTLLETPNSKFTGTAGQLRYEWTGLDTIVEGDTNGDRKADFSIALEGTLTLKAFDFEL